MGLLNRASQGRTYDGKESERKGILDNIAWEMQEEELVKKISCDNLTTGTTLFVHESQMAFFFKDRVLYDRFGPGKYKLESGNIPLLQGALNIATGGSTTFKAEVWFVNTELVKRNMPWGVGKTMTFVDSYLDIRVKYGARGQYGIKISNPEIFLKTMVGTLHLTTTDKIYEQFRIDVIEGMRVHVKSFIKQHNLSINDLDEEYINMARFVKQELEPRFDEYGIELLNFNIEQIVIDEEDEAYREAMAGHAEGAKDKNLFNKVGDRYFQKRQLDILDKAAQNEGIAGGMMGAGLGAGMGFGVGNAMGGAFQQPPQQQAVSSPQAVAPPPIASFHISQNGQSYGPYTFQQIQVFVSQGSVTKDTPVWKQGMTNWENAGAISELSSLFSPTPPPPPPSV